VPGGTFVQGTPQSTSGETSFADSVADFVLDKYEVTVGRFRQFVNNFNGTPPNSGAGANPTIQSEGSDASDGSINSGWDSTWNTYLAASAAELISNVTNSASCGSLFTWTTSPGANDSMAMNCVSWYEAFAFCAWDGGFLPTEAEWEYAATGGSLENPYPWGGSTPTPSLANFGDNVGAVTSVGSYPSGRGFWGHEDLAGNVGEWVFDNYAQYPSAAASNYVSELPDSTIRVIRGGGWDVGAVDIASEYRAGGPPDQRNKAVGFRCARMAN
jgi:formylglycine-generating enzyme required for sulfatase activity